MYQGQTVFSQVMDFMPQKKFRHRLHSFLGYKTSNIFESNFTLAKVA